MASVGVIGSGTWGTSLAILLNGNGHKVQLWSAVPAEVESLSVNRKHPNLGDTPIPEAIEITGDLKAAMKDKDLLVLSVPSVYVRQTAAKMKPWLKPGQIVTNVAKGIEEATLKRRTSRSRGNRPFRTEPCRRSEQRSSYHLCSRRSQQGSSRICAEFIYESCIPRIHESGYVRH